MYLDQLSSFFRHRSFGNSAGGGGQQQQQGHRRTSTVAQMFRNVKEASQATALLLQSTDQQFVRQSVLAQSMGGGSQGHEGAPSGHEVRWGDLGGGAARGQRLAPSASTRRRTANDVSDSPLRGSPLVDSAGAGQSVGATWQSTPPPPPRAAEFDVVPLGGPHGLHHATPEKRGGLRSSAFSTAIPAAMRASGILPEQDDCTSKPDLAFILVWRQTS